VEEAVPDVQPQSLLLSCLDFPSYEESVDNASKRVVARFRGFSFFITPGPKFSIFGIFSWKIRHIVGFCPICRGMQLATSALISRREAVPGGLGDRFCII
jgi:hypothetical protein